MCYMLIIAALYLAVFFLANYDPKTKADFKCKAC